MGKVSAQDKMRTQTAWAAPWGENQFESISSETVETEHSAEDLTVRRQNDQR